MAESSPERSARSEGGEIATSTLAEIYAQQGLLGRALSIYRRMLTRTPEDTEIAGRIGSLERRIAESGMESEPRTQPEFHSEEPPAAERERLPWDPPQADGQETAVDEPAAMTDSAAEPAAKEPAALDSGRVRPIDSQAFAAWLEGR